MNRILLTIAGWLTGACFALAQPVATNGVPAVIERGTYVNYGSCTFSAYAIFANFSEGSDSRLAQFLVGWDTTAAVPTNNPVTGYLIRHCQVTVTLNNGNQVIHDPTHDKLETYFDTNNPARLPDTDAGRPIELFGVDFRPGYSATNFIQCSPVGSGAPGSNNVFAVSWSTNGLPVDVGNNVGKTLPEFAPFETWPFAVAQTTNAAPGSLMPVGAHLTFDLNLTDPFLVGYLQRASQQGRLDLMVSSLHQVSGQFGAEPYPSFITRFNSAVLNPPTTLDLEVTVVRDIDTDNDGLPDDWEQFYFTNLVNTAEGDFDSDNANNGREFQAGTDPTLSSSIFRLASGSSTNGRTVLRWPNLPSRHFDIEYTENLSTWQTITNPPLIFHLPTTAEWTDPNTTNASRLYRVQAHAD